MRRTALSLAGLAILGSLQYLRPGTEPAHQAQTPSSQVAKSAPQSPSAMSSKIPDDKSAASALCRYFLPPGGKALPEPPDVFEIDQKIVLWNKKSITRLKAAEGNKPPDPSICLPKKYQGGAAFLISTVPDPINSHLVLEYDRMLESIERAAYDSGYTFDRYWVPWSEAYIQPQTDLEKLHAAQDELRIREQEPGVVIFHRSPGESADKPKLLLVFLVGESPASGLNKVALYRAVTYIRHLRNRLPRQSMVMPTLPIVGPIFSSSLHSFGTLLLDPVLERANCPQPTSSGPANFNTPPCVSITSASVSNRDAIAEFQRAAGERNQFGIRVTFSVLTVDDKQRSENIVPELKKISGAKDSSEIAYISETASSNRGAAPTGNLGLDTNVLHLYFPRGIAALRNAYQAEQDKLAALKSKQTDQLPRVGLPLSYREPDYPQSDTVPVIAKDQTPLSQDAIMQQIVNSLKERKIKAVVVSSTSTLDTLFLMHYLREASPGIRIALPGADLLEVRTTDPKDFSGTITFNSFPLFANSITFADNRQYKFASTVAEGHYFAVLAALADSLKNQNRAIRSPALWMGVIGKAALWPIKVLLPSSASPEDAISALPGDVLFKTPLPGGFWYFLITITSFACGLHCGAILITNFNVPGSRRKRAGIGRKWWLEYYAFDHGDRHYTQAAGCFLLFATLNIAILDFVITLPAFRLYSNSAHRPLLPGLFLVVSAISLLLSLLVIVLTAMRGFLSTKMEAAATDHKVKWSLRGFVLAALAAFVAVCSIWFALCFGKNGELFSYRAVFVQSGVNPSLPALFIAAGLYVYAIASMRRITYFQNRFATFPTEFNAVLHSNFEELERTLANSLTPLTFFNVTNNIILLIALMLAGALLWYFRLTPLSLEGSRYDFIVFAGVYAIWVALLLCLVRFLEVWLVLKKMLLRLERLPIRYAFSRIPGLFSWTPIWRLGGIKRSMLVQTRSLEYLRCLEGPTGEELPRPILHKGAAVLAPARLTKSFLISHEDRREVTDKLNTVLALETQGVQIGREPWIILDDSLRREADKLVSSLYDVWQAGGADSASEDLNVRRKDLPKGPGLESDWEKRVMLAAEFVALRFVAVIRYISLQMRNMLVIMSSGFVLAILALKSYPFQPREFINVWIIVVFLVLGSGIVFVFSGLSRDPILKRMTATRAGKLDNVFIWPLIKFGALPLLTLLASQFPGLSNFLFSWVEPALDKFH